ncbi:MAG: WG repeat-containing protein [Bacteroidia bacterium]
MTKKILLLSLYLICAYFTKAQDLVTKIDSRSGKVGIWNEKTKKWTTAPIYRNIQHAGEYIGDEYRITYFIGIGPKYTLIPKNGIATGAPVFDEIKEVARNPLLALVKIKKAYWIYRIGKGLLVPEGSFSDYATGGNPRYLKLKKGNNWQLFDTQKLRLLPLSYPDIRETETDPGDSLPVFVVQKEKWGLADANGKLLIPCDYDALSSEFPLRATKENKCGIFDRNGKVIIPCEYDSIENKVVVAMRSGSLEEAEVYRLKKNEAYTYADRNGKICEDVKYTTLHRGFSGRYGPASQLLFQVKYNDKWGIVDSSNQIVIPFIYDELGELVNGNLAARKDGKAGAINLKNEIVFPFSYDYYQRMDKDFLRRNKNTVLVNKGCNCDPLSLGGLWGMTDTSGNVLIEAQASITPLYLQGFYYHDPELENYEDSTLIGYLWNIGGEKTQTVSSVDSADLENYDVEGNMSMARQVMINYSFHFEGGKTGIMSLEGKFILKPEFDNLIISSADRYGERSFFNLPVNRPDKNSSGQYHVNKTQDVIAVKNKKFGIYSWEGKEIIPCQYDSIAFEYTHSCSNIVDSLFTLRGYPKTIYKVYSNGKYGYREGRGAELAEPLIYRDLMQLDIASYDSVLLNANYTAFPENLSCVNVVSGNPLFKNYQVHQRKEIIDPNTGGEMQVDMAEDFGFTEKGPFNFLDNSSLKLSSNNWAEDLLLIDNNFRPYKLSSLQSQLRMSVEGDIDSLCDGNTKIIAYLRDPGQTSALFFLDYLFIKQQGKWYLKNFYNEALLNKGCGFDSISMYNGSFFKGWLNGKYAYYSFKARLFSPPEIGLEFPESSESSKIVCSNCEFEMKKYVAQASVQNFDAEGVEMITTVDVVHETPFVKKGKFNILDESNSLVLDKWADEIRIAVPDPRYNFSVTDSSSSVYKHWGADTPEGWPLFNMYKQSIALKYGSTWRVTSLTKPEICLDGFDDASYVNSYWAVKKNGKTALIDTNGNYTIQPRHENFSLCAPVEFEAQAEQLFVNYTNGKANPFYRFYASNLVIGVNSGKYGVYSSSGKEIIPPLYDSISYEFNRGYDYEQDSLSAALGSHNYYFKAWQGKLFGYFSVAGKQLSPLSIEKELGDIVVPTWDSLADKKYAGRFTGAESSVEIVAAQTETRQLKVYSEMPSVDADGNEFMDTTSERCNLVIKGKFNFVYKPATELMQESWFDDVLLIGNYESYPLSSIYTQLLINSFPCDSITDPLTNKKIPGKPASTGNRIKDLRNTVFVKKENKWFPLSLFNPGLFSGSIGFDSIAVNGSDFFKGYLNNKFAYYSFSQNAEQAPAYELEYPGSAVSERIVCRNCTYEMKKCKEGITVEEIDGWGNSEFSVSYQASEIPLIKKGELNILSTDYELLLANWADDILLPAANKNCSLGLSDGNGAVYQQETHQLSNTWLGTSKASIALKYGNSWRLTTVAHPETFIDGFEKVIFQNGFWEATKNGKTYFYQLENLKEK